jgi:hypothetical protein
MSKTIALHTHTSAVVRAYPWLNGIALCEQRSRYLKEALQNSAEPELLIEMALVGCVQTTYCNRLSLIQLVTVPCSTGRFNCCSTYEGQLGCDISFQILGYKRRP